MINLLKIELFKMLHKKSMMLFYCAFAVIIVCMALFFYLVLPFKEAYGKVTLTIINTCAPLIILTSTLNIVTSFLQEYSGGTMKLILTRPISRSSLLCSKILTGVIYSFTCTLFVCLATFLITGFLFGFSNTGMETSLAEGELAAYTALFIGLNAFVQSIFFMVIALTIAIVTKSYNTTIFSSLGLYLAGEIVGRSLYSANTQQVSLLAYTPLGALKLSNPISDLPYEFPIYSAQVGLLFVYVGIFVLISALLFKEKEI